MPDNEPIRSFQYNTFFSLSDTVAEVVNVVAFDFSDPKRALLEPLSNSAILPMKMATQFGERDFPSVEHYVQYMKDPSNETYLNELLKTDNNGKVVTNGIEVIDIAKKHFKTMDPDKAQELTNKWQQNSDNVMREAIKAKIEQHRVLMKPILKSSYTTCIRYGLVRSSTTRKRSRCATSPGK